MSAVAPNAAGASQVGTASDHAATRSAAHGGQPQPRRSASVRRRRSGDRPTSAGDATTSTINTATVDTDRSVDFAGRPHATRSTPSIRRTVQPRGTVSARRLRRHVARRRSPSRAPCPRVQTLVVTRRTALTATRCCAWQHDQLPWPPVQTGAGRRHAVLRSPQRPRSHGRWRRGRTRNRSPSPYNQPVDSGSCAVVCRRRDSTLTYAERRRCSGATTSVHAVLDGGVHQVALGNTWRDHRGRVIGDGYTATVPALTAVIEHLTRSTDRPAVTQTGSATVARRNFA